MIIIKAYEPNSFLLLCLSVCLSLSLYSYLFLFRYSSLSAIAHDRSTWQHAVSTKRLWI